MLAPTGRIIFNSSPTEDLNSIISMNNSLVNEGKNEAIKDLVKEEEKSKQKLDDLLTKSNRVLFKLASVFPFDLFPNKITIDENKINIIIKEFFWSEQIHSVMIKDVTDVLVETSLLFATLIIIDEGFTEKEIRIPYLWKKEAKEARKIIQGLVVSSKGGMSPMLGGVELSLMSSQDLVGKLESLGEAVK